ncbi:hypothetical protein ACF0H5_019176 [Mactra antiquata]
MPQATNMKVWRDKELSPVGPGTVFNKVSEISASTRERVQLVNKTEEYRLERIMRLIDKEHRFTSNLQNRVIERTSKILKEKKALSQLLEKDYKVKNFITMRQGFDSSTIDNKEHARRYVIESRVFNSGFNMKAMKPEVYRRIRKLDPNHKYKLLKKRLLADAKEQNVEMNHAVSETAFDHMLHDRKHWQKYNYPPSHEIWSVDTLPTIPVNENEAQVDNEPIGKDSVREDQDNEKETDEQTNTAVKEKSIVIERRLPRREQQNAYSMTMRTLGPVYFQASVSTEQIA